MERYEIVVDDEGNYCGLIPSENGSVVKYADVQATVEALQRERDEAKKMEAVQKEVADNQTWHVRELRTALDAERETNRGLITLLQQHVGETGVSEGAVDVLKRKLGELTQLQALVRPFAELAKHLDGREFNTLLAILRNGTWIKVTMDDFMALRAATLDATTPAGGQG